MATVIRATRGLEADILAGNFVLGRILYATDTHRFFIGTGSGVTAVKINSSDVIDTNVADGLVKLDANAKVPTSLLPALAITDVYAVADIPARDALTVESGDVAIVASNATTYIYDGTSWLEITAPNSVTSVNGETGAVVLSLDDLDNVNAASPAAGDALVWDAVNNEWVPGAGGVGTFLELTDTPSNYASFGGYLVRVNAAESELEFTNEIDGGTI